ncbi:FadR/GntR family transcriptional regulator [Virgisporangium aurantiacum]|uniref:Transcriptional regulator n=1 Tax=Virgisporangium aurantiacum TaxID=175570 RepID=A0A8J3ZE75_9ACTN|nr:FadR/GntR family transcriptional regulator [Virgisporangium aurantiacum]GIJ60180.1 transcriptional regulator [Virgisporangium aurantiacum]
MARISRSAEVSQAVVDLIVGQGLRPGAPLPTEAQLMADLGTSRGPLREAVKTLQAQGIVEVRHGYGTFVGLAGADAILPWLTFRARDVSTLADLLDVREMIEIGLARRLAGGGVPADTVTALRECVETMRSGGAGSAPADRRFHELICEAAGNALARDLVRVFWQTYARAEHQVGERRSDGNALADRHRAVVDALAGGDPAAAEDAVRRHFDEVRERLARAR